MRLALGLACTTACWTSRPPAPHAPAPVDNAVHVDTATVGFAGPAPRPVLRFPLHSVWEGTYVCSQGLSYVKLTLDAERSGVLRARYDFGAVPSNPGVPSGAYTMTGGIRATDSGFSAQLEPDEWLEHPTGYVMVGLTLRAEGRDLSGTIQHSSCSDFKARRVE